MSFSGGLFQIDDTFASLTSARWHIAERTYGNSHATLIGVLVDWWIGCDVQRNTVLDGPPSHGLRNAGQADAVFCSSDAPIGVLEVEGTQPIHKVKSISQYFATARPELTTIRFGILLVYAYAPAGSRERRGYRPAEDPSVLDAIKKTTRDHPKKPIIYVTVDKRFQRISTGVRRLNEYYSGQVEKVTAVLVVEGEERQRTTLLPSDCELKSGTNTLADPGVQ